MASRRAFLGVSAIVFAASAATTIVSCRSMSAMGEMQMPGGWTMSMMWMRMPGQTWASSGASFAGMWVVMMVAMMVPSLTPALWRYREAIGSPGTTGPGGLTALAGLGYFLVWTLVGTMVFPLGVAMAATLMRHPALSRAAPIAAGMAVVLAGIFQRTPWKARHLAFCREAPLSGRARAASAGGALRHGVRLGLHCCHSCAGPTIVVLSLGIMDLGVMVIAATAITAERLAPARVRAGRAIGTIGIAAGLLLIARAIGLG